VEIAERLAIENRFRGHIDATAAAASGDQAFFSLSASAS
jgi:hypothetical protein